jgi:hypothetical protein
MKWLMAMAVVAGVTAGGVKASAEAPPAGEGYTATTSYVASASGASGKLRVEVAIAEPYHWNNEYPAKLEVDGALPGTVEAPQRIVKAKDGGFQVTPHKVTADLPVTVKGARGGEVAVTAKFSICSAELCLMKTAKLKAWVGGR